jgi:uncharacterized membrane protein YadS
MATTATDQHIPLKKSSSWYLQEDWLAVWLGFATITLVLAGLRPALPAWKWSSFSQAGTLFSTSNLLASVWLAVGFLAVSLPGIVAMGGRVRAYLAAFPVVFALAWIAQAIAGNATVSYWGIEYIIPALGLGLFLSNVIGLPDWLTEAVRTEYFIKTGLVVMGATLLFGEIMQAGALGMLQAVLVILVVWYIAFRICKWLRLDDEFSAMISTAVSICGVSAAIAACGAIQGDRRKLSYVASVVLIVAVPMIVLQPWIVKIFGIPDAVGGAWLGGTLDTTGSVVAAGGLISETAVKIGTIVKFSQNVLIWVAAFALSLWWAMKARQNGSNERPSLRVIWDRFPKFVLGFLVASVVFSFLLRPEQVAATKSTLTSLRTMWFALAFVCIGLETRFTDLLTMENGRPFYAFVAAQGVNLIWTFLLSWLLFGGILFAIPQF